MAGRLAGCADDQVLLAVAVQVGDRERSRETWCDAERSHRPEAALAVAEQHRHAAGDAEREVLLAVAVQVADRDRAAGGAVVTEEEVPIPPARRTARMPESAVATSVKG
jgi:hypothetical protein